MSRNRSIDKSNFVSEIVALLAGTGILTMLLFPFAVPLLLLTAAAAAVLALPLVALGLVVGPVLAIRSIWRHWPRHSDHSADKRSSAGPIAPLPTR
jgi:hypothetical protein